MPLVTAIGPRGETPRLVSQSSRNQKKGQTSASITGKNITKCINRVQVAARHQKPAVRRPEIKHNFRVAELSKNGTSTCPSTFRIPLSKSCRKSLSMMDLSPSKTDAIRSEAVTELVGMAQAVERTGIRSFNGKYDNEKGLSIKSAASLVCRALALNAWRRRREEAVELRGTIEKLGQQGDHLQLQIVVLRRLLEAENSRVTKLGSEVHRTNAQLENEIKQRKETIADKEKLEGQVKRAHEIAEEKGIFAENLRNELLSVKDQLSALETQMSKEREKLLKLREDKKILLEKVSASEALAGDRGDRADRAEKMIEELQGRLGVQVGIIDTLQGDKQKLCRDLKFADIEKIKLEKRLSSSEESGKALSLRVNSLEIQLSDREAALRRIEIAYKAQLMELNGLREQLIRQCEESKWSNRVFQIAGSVVRAPRAILRTLSFLSPNSLPSHP